MQKLALVFFYLLLSCLTSVTLYADLKNAPLPQAPENITIDAKDLLNLQQAPLLAEEHPFFAVTVSFYYRLLNLAGRSKEAHDRLYTSTAAAFILDSEDAQGNYQYTLIPGTEEFILGYSACLDPTEFHDVFYQPNLENIPPNTSTLLSGKKAVWICLNSTAPLSSGKHRSSTGYHCYQYNDEIGANIDVYLAWNKPQKETQYSLPDELWIGLREDGTPLNQEHGIKNSTPTLTPDPTIEPQLKTFSTDHCNQLQSREKATYYSTFLSTILKYWAPLPLYQKAGIILGETTIAILNPPLFGMINTLGLIYLISEMSHE